MQPHDPLRPFRIAPIRSNGKLRELAQLKKLERNLYLLADGKGATIAFSECYFAAYNLVLHGRGEDVRNLTLEVLRKLSLARGECAYYKLVSGFYNIIMYCERTYVQQMSLNALKWEATQLYDRKVAVYWRRVRLWALWDRRLNQWRDAFVDTKFKPGGSGAVTCAEEFYEFQTKLNDA